ncbi:lipase class 3 family protein [Euphorbia peplus]|nr:lipase class 3 family protein [Euphorbia peplus]
MAIWVSQLKSLRIVSVILVSSNFLIFILAIFLMLIVNPGCHHANLKIPLMFVSLAAAARIFVMVLSAVAQAGIARTIQDSLSDDSVIDSVIRLERRTRYKTWLGWSRFSIVITLLQIIGAVYLFSSVADFVTHDGNSSHCLLGLASNGHHWKQILLIIFVVMACVVPLIQCFAGSEVLRWRSFYTTEDDVWKAHYNEVFDHGIREVLCCLGRIEYLQASEEDEVCSVAQLLGDLVAYRASGTGHLELLAGLALLQRHSSSPDSYEGVAEASIELIQDALDFHKFAEAAYTGPLLDFGRHSLFFPCSWIHRQGILTPWTRNRRPKLTGDNWWRGHAAAFLKYVDLPPEALRRGRVCQEKCEAAYFIVVLHDLQTIVIAVRGTETPEDLITDGLGRECSLSEEDLSGLINCSHIDPNVKRNVEASFPHYGHMGVVEAARDLYMQIEGNSDEATESSGFLSSLMGAGCECDGYRLCVVGHSLGGAIATLLGLRLYSLYPNLHVYAFGPLPCMDSVIAEACSEFVTSIIHDSEFSARLSVGSVLRLRASAITALSEDSKTDTALIFRLARQFLYVNKCQIEVKDPSDLHSPVSSVEDLRYEICSGSSKLSNNLSPWKEANESSLGSVGDFYSDSNSDSEILCPKEAGIIYPPVNPVSQFLEALPKTITMSARDPPEMFLPGLVVHMVPERRTLSVPLWRSWINQEIQGFNAYLAHREDFKDILVSPKMFLDHLPWRGQNAMLKILETHNSRRLPDEANIVKIRFDMQQRRCC